MTVDSTPHDTTTYAARFAERYDDWFSYPNTTPDTVELLAGLAGAGPALELGIGTGRVALPLSAAGVEVHGVEGAPEMAARLRGKPGGERIAVTLGDFGDVPVDGLFTLVYVAAGSFFELTTQEAQLGCFVNVARRLGPGGVFVLDSHPPEIFGTPEFYSGQVVPTGSGELVVRYRRVTRSTQCYESHYVVTGRDGTHHIHVPFRYAAAGELDLMAHLAGLRLRSRFGDWSGAPYDDRSDYLVSVYEIAD